MTRAVLKPFEVSEDEVARLSAIELVQLIKRLIEADLQLWGAPLSAVQGTLRINISDGGEDIRVEWRGPALSPDGLEGMFNYFTVFQLKAENLTDAKLAQEPFEKDGKQLKAAVQEVLNRRGSYILVTSKTNVITPKRGKGAKVPRLDQMRGHLRASIRKGDPRADSVAQIDIYGPPKITDWINRHPMVAVWLKQLLGIASADFAFQTLDDWTKYRDLSNELASWPTLTDQIRDIQNLLAKPREVIRLLGHAGLGKSRLAFEAVRTEGNVGLAPIVAYAREYTPELVNQVRDFIKNRRRVVLVVDECPPDGHRRLSQEVHRADSLLSMITLDLEFDDPPPEDSKIVLETAPTDAIRDILKASGVSLRPEDLERATEFCSGFPLIAVLVAAGLASGSEHFADFQDPENITKKLVWGRGAADEELFQCLRSIALFEAVGVMTPKDSQLRWIAINLLDMAPTHLEAKIERFYRRRILQKRGYSILVRPRPLAAQLAATFWRNATGAQLNRLLEGSMPDELKQALCDRLSDLGYLTDACAVAAKLCGRSGPFGSAKALNTDIGARCLRRLAEVAPVDVMETLEREFAALDLKVLKTTVGPGRRWLVWTLDALSWEPATFQQSMALLLRFAAAENESWSNNATGEFVQRFRVKLPGTSVDLGERLKCLKSLVDSAEDDELPILIAAFGAALDARGGSRTIGSENHGTRKKYEDYQPKRWDEVFAYLRGVLELLKQVSSRNSGVVEKVRKEFAGIDASMLISEPMFSDYENTVELLKPEGATWGALLEQLAWQLNHRLTVDDAKQVREVVKRLFSRLLPQALEDRIVFYVKNVPYHFSEPDSGERDYERNSKRAAELGAECARNWPVFEKVVATLSDGETRQSFAFGRAFLEVTDTPKDAIELAILSLEAAHRPNESLLGGMANALFTRDRFALEQLLSRVAQSASLRKYLPYLATLNLTSGGLNMVVDLLEDGHLNPESVSIFGMGGVLQPMPTTDVKRLMNVLIDRGPTGAWVAVDLLSMYLHSDKAKLSDVRQEADRAVRSAPLRTDKSGQMAEYSFETLAKALLDDAEYGGALAEFMAAQVIKLAGEYRSTSNRLAQQLTELILVKHAAVVLPVFASHVEHVEREDRWFFTHVLGAPFSFDEKGEGALFKLGLKLVMEACKAYPANFAVVVAEMAPLFITRDGRKHWTEIGTALLDEFGTRKDILSALSTNIGTGGWSGPTSAYLQSFLAPLEELKTHAVRQVRAWARERLKILHQQIERELLDEEEEAVRRG